MNESEMPIPHLFRCPISLDLLTDPVTLCTGQTYDRSSIEKWLATGNHTCPVTMQKLHDPSMVPNHTLRHLIYQWLQMGPHLDPDYLEIDPDLSLAALRHNLESNESPLETKLQALERIQVLITREFPWRNSWFTQLGLFPFLLEQLFGKVEANEYRSNLNLAEQALSCVLALMPFGELGSLNMLKEESSLASFLVLFQQGTITVKISLCHLVGAISSSQEVKELCAELGKNQRLLREIVLLVCEHSEAAEAGIKATLALCSLEQNRENLVREGAVDGLITYISSVEGCEKSSAPLAMAAIELLLGVEGAKQAVINNPNGVKALVKMVFRVSDHEGSESAIDSLMIVCYESLWAQEDAISAGILTQLLLLLQSQCRGRTKTKARALLKLLQSLWAKETKHV
ncbi:U-box domain-containing protein 25-like [Malania oleifera]|uniref:U-box domain-containing protein 25-like n=1 Tax=Malania oleifera TaxID=397392 RepID=UPI0025AE581E|nr:U-box domain-containing protein 25-like [Malania oleifera]